MKFCRRALCPFHTELHSLKIYKHTAAADQRKTLNEINESKSGTTEHVVLNAACNSFIKYTSRKLQLMILDKISATHFRTALQIKKIIII